MKTIRKILLLLGLPVLMFAQTNTFTTTYLSAAVPAPTAGTATSIALNSCTGVNAPSLPNGTSGSVLFTFDGEPMQVIQVVNTSPCIVTVNRGILPGGSRAFAHPTGLLVFIGNPEWYSGAAVGTHPQGTCTAANLNVNPDIHTLDGTFWGCRSDGVWGFAGPSIDAYGAIPNRTLVSTTYTALPWDYFIAVNTTGGAFTLTLPTASLMPGKVYIIQDEGDDASSNHLTVTTANGCASITTSYGSCRVISNGTAWFAF